MELIEQGKALEGEKDWAGGLILFQQAIELDPNCAEAWAHVGICHKKMGDLKPALAAYQKAIELSPDQAIRHWGLGDTYRHMECYEDALVAFDHSIALDEDFYSSHRDKAFILHFRLQRSAEALVVYDHVVTLQKSTAADHFNRAQVLRSLNKVDQAIAAYQAALDGDPKSVRFARTPAGVLADERPAEALEFAKAWQILEPENWEPKEQIARIFVDQAKKTTRLEEAASLLESALKLREGEHIYITLIKTYAKLGRVDDAQNLFNKYKVRSGGDPDFDCLERVIRKARDGDTDPIAEWRTCVSEFCAAIPEGLLGGISFEYDDEGSEPEDGSGGITIEAVARTYDDASQAKKLFADYMAKDKHVLHSGFFSVGRILVDKKELKKIADYVKNLPDIKKRKRLFFNQQEHDTKVDFSCEVRAK